MPNYVYFDNFTPVGDVVVLAVSFVIIVLVTTSYVNKNALFKVFITIVFFLIGASCLDILQHSLYTRVDDGNYTIVCIIRIVYHVFLYSNLFLYVIYIVTILRLEDEKKFPAIAFSSIVYFVFIALEVFLFIKDKGFRIDSKGVAEYGYNTFYIGYFSFIAVITYLMLRFQKRLYKRVMISFYETVAISLMIMLHQYKLGQSSFTVVSFLFPAITMLYMVHSVPYDIELGAINGNTMEEMIYYCYRKKQDLFFMSLYMPDFDIEGRAFPKLVQETIRHFSVDYFNDAVLFQISNGHVLLFAKKKNNPHLDKKIKKLIDEFQQEYQNYKYDYKMILGYSQVEISKKNEYLSFIKSIQMQMNLNEIHMVDENDLEKYKEYENILVQLTDIYKKRNLNDSRILAFCQPVYNIKTGKYDTAEALMRMEIPGIGRIYPDKFIPIAEENRYIHILTEIMLTKVCEEIKKMIAEGFEINRVSVNVSAIELRDDAFIDDINKIISESAIPAHKVAFEITESQSENEFILIKDKIDSLKEKGIKFYLDDFGTGYSNMERILELPFDIIKFDRSLVIASDENERSQKVVESLAQLFSDLEYSVLYEGIETDSDEKRCIGMSAVYLQGYKYSKPIPIEDLRNFFSRSQAAE